MAEVPIERKSTFTNTVDHKPCVLKHNDVAAIISENEIAPDTFTLVTFHKFF